ncbi:hypothetical protein FAZ95_23760 [Trinickia violacea]|uniref:Uncharacterized protein n=1 Tax=Trinickia violacea TaxID=2571746 RepID=A0A4P8IUY4_9BURK|nr:hypothetical protein [Trinickia violacea]QCP52201.1 hypothetical protein FAZ95_23760 [Trinickia violacea]
MNSHHVVAMSFETKEAIPTNIARVQPAKTKQASLYASLLQNPLAMLASNVSDRADVSFAAILGYN